MNTERSGPGPIPPVDGPRRPRQSRHHHPRPVDERNAARTRAPIDLRSHPRRAPCRVRERWTGRASWQPNSRRTGASESCCPFPTIGPTADRGDPPLGSDQAGRAAIDPAVLGQLPEHRRKARSERRPRRIGDPPSPAEGQDVVAVLVEQVGGIEQGPAGRGGGEQRGNDACIGKRASGEDRPGIVLVRLADPIDETGHGGVRRAADARFLDLVGAFGDVGQRNHDSDERAQQDEACGQCNPEAEAPRGRLKRTHGRAMRPGILTLDKNAVLRPVCG